MNTKFQLVVGCIICLTWVCLSSCHKNPKEQIKSRNQAVINNEEKLIDYYNQLSSDGVSSLDKLMSLPEKYKKLGFALPSNFNRQLVAYSSEAAQSVLTGNYMDCSGDPADMFAYYAKQAEKIALSQFPITASEEKKHGDEAHEEGVSMSFKVIDNDLRRNKLVKILNKMLPYRERKEIDYTIHLIDDDNMINAFAILGGHLYFTTGLLEFVNSDDELAVIIGHELGHVDKKHCVQKIQKFKAASQTLGEDMGAILTNIEAQLSAPFGQIDEYESDKSGAYFAHKIGYNPRKGKDFFTKLEKDENYDIVGKLTRTHPYSSQRKLCLEHYIKNDLGL